MPRSSPLLQRAERALACSALAALAATTLPAQADVLTTRDFVVEGSGAYFYNASGFFADWAARPVGGTVEAQNPDLSAKFYGSASADSALLLAHNCRSEPVAYCNRVGERGVALAWWGRLAAPAREGDQLAVAYDLTVNLPDWGGEWALSATVQPWAPGNNVPGSLLAQGSAAQGSSHFSGTVMSSPLAAYEVEGGEPLRWQIVAWATADLGESVYLEAYNSYTYRFGGVGLQVPANSIDVSVVNTLLPAVPEPGTLAMALAGAAGLLLRRRPWR